MKSVKYDNLRMVATAHGDGGSMIFYVASGFADFPVTIRLNKDDFEVIEKNEDRAALLCAAMHHPFQLKESALNYEQQRNYLDVILHFPESEVEKFLTEKDHGRANGAISNYMRLACSREPSLMRDGQWFKQ